MTELDVRGPSTRRARPEPPRIATTAMWLIVAGAVLELLDGVFSAVMFLTGPGDLSSDAVGVIGWTILAVGVLAALAARVRRGSSGSRLALTVLGVGWVVTSPAHTATSPVSIIVGVLETGVIVATLVLVHLPVSTRWFSGPAASVSPRAPRGAPPRTASAHGAQWTATAPDPDIRAARSAGWRVLGVVVGLGLPLTLVWAFLVAWWASDGCSGGSTKPQCEATTLLLQGSAPAIATLVATLITVTGLVLARPRPATAQRVIHAGLVAWFVVGAGLYLLAQHV